MPVTTPEEPTETSTGTLVIGAGLAAAKLVEALREGGYDAGVVIVGEEGELPYERPPLSKELLLGSKPREEVFAQPRSWYDEHRVDLRLDDRAETIDLGRRLVGLSSGAAVAYDRLVLATGSRPFVLPIAGATLPGVRLLRTLADSDLLASDLADGGPRRWAIIGGGWIGLEVAAAARNAGRDVTVLEAAEQPLGAVLGLRLGEYFAALHRAHGVDVRTGTQVQGIEKDGDGLVVHTAQGDVPADLVVMAVGARPEDELAREAGLDADHGVLVDEQLVASDPHVLAVGDVANAQHATLGRLRVEHWDNAIRQGQLAAATILGADARYDWAPYFFTDQYDLGMEYVGHHDPADAPVIRGDLDSGEFLVFWRDAGGVVTGAMNVNIWDVNDDLRALIGRQVDEQRLADAGIALSDL